MSSEPKKEGMPFQDCPVSITETETILMGHGSGGKLTAQVIEKILLPAFDNPALNALDDQAILEVGGSRIAFTTDSYVVTPIFFPGGDIGELAVNGTVNDLVMGGAKPLFLSLAFILEEGLPLDELRRVVESARRASERVGVPIVTGDTKVVGRGNGDKVFVNTSGIGLVPPGIDLSSRHVRPGDAILLSGTIGDHGIAILSRREGLEFEGAIESDTAPLHELVEAALGAYPGIHAMRDPTRGESRPRSWRSPPASVSAWRSMRTPSPSRTPCAAPARSSGSTRCSSPTRASSWPSSPKKAATPCSRRSGAILSELGRAGSAESPASIRALSSCALRSAAIGYWICRSPRRFPGSADPAVRSASSGGRVEGVSGSRLNLSIDARDVSGCRRPRGPSGSSRLSFVVPAGFLAVLFLDVLAPPRRAFADTLRPRLRVVFFVHKHQAPRGRNEQKECHRRALRRWNESER